MPAKLAACPVCRQHRVDTNSFGDDGRKLWIVYCGSAQCGGVTATEPYRTVEAAIAAWNKGKVNMEMRGAK